MGWAMGLPSKFLINALTALNKRDKNLLILLLILLIDTLNDCLKANKRVKSMVT